MGCDSHSHGAREREACASHRNTNARLPKSTPISRPVRLLLMALTVQPAGSVNPALVTESSVMFSRAILEPAPITTQSSNVSMGRSPVTVSTRSFHVSLTHEPLYIFKYLSLATS